MRTARRQMRSRIPLLQDFPTQQIRCRNGRSGSSTGRKTLRRFLLRPRTERRMRRKERRVRGRERRGKTEIYRLNIDHAGQGYNACGSRRNVFASYSPLPPLDRRPRILSCERVRIGRKQTGSLRTPSHRMTYRWRQSWGMRGTGDAGGFQRWRNNQVPHCRQHVAVLSTLNSPL